MMSVLFAVAVAAQAPQPVARPEWVRRPTGNDVARVYPLAAQLRNVSGKAQMACQVHADGTLHDCKVVSEEPAGFGFGDATLRLAKDFQMRPVSAPDGVEGAQVNIPVQFVIVDGEAQWVRQLESAAWTAAPNFADVARAYPSKGAGSVGLVTLRCLVGDDGAVRSRCDTLGEAPTYKGFAQSARALAPLFHIDPRSEVLRQGKPLWVKLTFRLAPADSDEVRNRRIADPRWVAAPTPDEIRQMFPAQAMANGVTAGRGVASCTVAADGSMTACKPAPGQPDAQSFSEAAVAIASMVRMSPWTNAGGPVDGAVVNLPIRFELTPAASIPPSARP
jgi:TonB family protein